MRLYLDTNVIMDFLLGRDSRAYDLLVKTLACHHTFVISTLVIRELHRHHLREETSTFIAVCEGRGKIVVLPLTLEDWNVAKGLATHQADALHYVVSCRGADAFVTKNVRDFPFTTIPVLRPNAL